jgi:hypothetical protein
MRVNRWVMLASLLIGITGIGFIYSATSTYVSTTRAYTSVDVVYERGSFVWLDPEFSQAEADVTILNRSETDITVTMLTLYLYFDGDFAGARYTPWERVDIPQGESLTVTTLFTVATARIQPRGGTGNLTLGGQIGIEFDGIREPLAFRLSGNIGQVSEVRE